MTRSTLITKTSGFFGAPWHYNYVNVPYCNFYIHAFLMTMPNTLLITTTATTLYDADLQSGLYIP